MCSPDLHHHPSWWHFHGGKPDDVLGSLLNFFTSVCVCAEKFTPDMVLGIPHFKTSSYCINKMMHMLFLQFNYLAHVFNWVGLSSQTCWSVWCDPDPRSIHLAWGVRSGWDCDPKAHSTVVKQQFHSTPSKDCYFMMMIMMMMMMMLLLYTIYIYIYYIFAIYNLMQRFL